MERITVRDLEAVCKRINIAVNGEALEPWIRENGHLRAVIDCYTLSGAYGGYSLHRIVGESGGVRDVFGCGHVAKRDLYERMQAFLRGIDVRSEVK